MSFLASGRIFGLGAFLLLFTNFPAHARTQPQPRATPYCAALAYHQFDFWIGDWDVFNADKPDTLEARMRVHRILDGCVLREDYQDVHGHKGQSFSIYDASSKVWHQTWVTNRGELLLLDGTFENGEMILRAKQIHGGKLTKIRGTWTPASGGFRETAVRSQDGGKTWQPWFDLVAQRMRSENQAK
jgi:hypothetical protein